MSQNERILINEITALLEHLNPVALESIKAEFPEFVELIESGPDAGSASENDECVKRLAQLALKGLEANEIGSDFIADKILMRIKNISRLKIIAVLCGGLTGVVALTPLLIGEKDAAIIAAIVSSVVSVVNGAIELFSKQYTNGLAARAVNLKLASESLRTERLKLKILLETNQGAESITTSANQCNDLAAKILQEKNFLSVY